MFDDDAKQFLPPVKVTDTPMVDEIQRLFPRPISMHDRSKLGLEYCVGGALVLWLYGMAARNFPGPITLFEAIRSTWRAPDDVAQLAAMRIISRNDNRMFSEAWDELRRIERTYGVRHENIRHDEVLP